MNNLHNIEKSAFRRREYVGYSDGAWRITRTNSSFGNWAASHATNQRAPMLFAWNLRQLSAKLENYKPD